MIVELLDTMTSLTAVLDEETDKLAAPGRHPDLAEIVSAKIRLVAALEAQTAQLNRERPGWLSEVPEGFAEQIRLMRDASVANAAILERQITLSADMMTAVAREAQRLTAASNTTYGAHGALFQLDQATPIALNASC